MNSGEIMVERAKTNRKPTKSHSSAFPQRDVVVQTLLATVQKGVARDLPAAARSHTFESQNFPGVLDSLRGSSGKIGTIQGRLAWPLRKDDTHKSRSENFPGILPQGALQCPRLSGTCLCVVRRGKQQIKQIKRT